MTRLFSLDRISNANAKFDRAKLLAFNTQTAEAAMPQRLRQALRDYLSVNPDSPLNGATDDQLFALLAMKKGFRTLRDVDESCRFFFTPDDEIVSDPVLRQGEALLADRSGISGWRNIGQRPAALFWVIRD